MSRSVTRAAVMTASLAAAVLVPTSLAQAQPPSCPRSMDLVTFESYLDLSRTRAAVDAGLATEEQVLAALPDENGDEAVCVKAPSNLRGNSTKHWEFYYLVTDNR